MVSAPVGTLTVSVAFRTSAASVTTYSVSESEKGGVWPVVLSGCFGSPSTDALRDCTNGRVDGLAWYTNWPLSPTVISVWTTSATSEPSHSGKTLVRSSVSLVPAGADPLMTE